MKECVMYQTGLVLTMACNLKCKLCSNYSPYYHKPDFYSIEYLKDQMKRYFSIVTHIKKLMVTGGEPFLHPELSTLIDEIKLYEDQLDVFGVITNGTLLPSEDLLRAAKDFGPKFHFLIDDYGPNLSVKAKELDELLTKHGINHIMRTYHGEEAHCGGWVYFGDLTEKKIGEKEEREALFSKCAYPQKLHFAFDLVGGAMYPCSVCRRCKELDVVDNYDEYIDLFDDSLTIEEQREKIANIYKLKSLEACAYCNGMTDDSPRFATAQQLTQEDILCIHSGANQYSEVQNMLGKKADGN